MRRVTGGIIVLSTIGWLGSVEVGSADNDVKDTVSQIMLKAHQPGRSARRALDQRVIDERASEKEKQQLLALYEALAQSKPPKGSEEDWNKRTAALVEAAKAVVKGEEGAAKKLSKTLDCKACHDRHRGPFAAVPAPTPKELKTPISPPPLVMVAMVGHDGRAFVERTFIRHQTRIVEMKKGDKVEKREESVPVIEVVRAFLDDKDVTVYDHKGQRIEPRDLSKRVRKTVPVLVSVDGKEVDKFYLSIVREGTLIVVAPPLAGSPPPPIVDMPRKKP